MVGKAVVHHALVSWRMTELGTLQFSLAQLIALFLGSCLVDIITEDLALSHQVHSAGSEAILYNNHDDFSYLHNPYLASFAVFIQLYILFRESFLFLSHRIPNYRRGQRQVYYRRVCESGRVSVAFISSRVSSFSYFQTTLASNASLVRP